MKQTTLSRYWDRGQAQSDKKESFQVVHRIAIAEQTLSAVEKGQYQLDGDTYDLAESIRASSANVKYYAPDSLLSSWSVKQNSTLSVIGSTPAQIDILEISTLEGARYLANNLTTTNLDETKIGILNFASAKKPGGGFLNGAQAQEESIARSSTLYPTLRTDVSRRFYSLHNNDSEQGFYTHAMIYSPNVIVFRTDNGDWTKPLKVDVLTCAAVNAGALRKSAIDITDDVLESKIEREMEERMARILFLFQKKGVQNLVLGSFGTGVFQNHVDMVAKIWTKLLASSEAPFKYSFNHIVFAILGKKTLLQFQDVFDKAAQGD